MKGNSLSKSDKELLLQQLFTQMNQGPKSAEGIYSTIVDRSGMKHPLGGRRSGILVDGNNIPQTMTEIQGVTLDCGHVVSGLDPELQMCDFGHIICHKHPLYRCSKCKKLICDIEVKWEDDQPVCPDHEISWVPVIIILVIAAIIIKAIM